MTSAQLLAEAFGRIRGVVHRVVDGLSGELLAFRADGEANSIAWLVWHLTRIQDDHVADAAGHDQVWTSQDWSDRFGLPFDPAQTGYGHGRDDVAKVLVEPPLLLGYHEAVHDRTIRFVTGLADGDLDRIVDENWDPPVTLGVRLVSVISDGLQHAGQAAYVRGLAERRSITS